MRIEELISKWGKQSDGETGLQKAIAEIQAQIQKNNEQILEDVMAEIARRETTK